jgi:MFS transporter, DHA1 family, inner membrane transport protein
MGLAAQDRRAAAVAIVWAGIAAANILGVPAGTALGQAFGGRATFWAIAALGAAAMTSVAVWWPETGHGATGIASELKALGKRQVILALGMSTLVCAATFSVFTYIAPLLTLVTGVVPIALPLYLLSFGVGGVIGMQVGARFADRNVIAAIMGAFASQAIVYVVLLLVFRSPASAFPMMFVWGFVFYFIAAPIQLRLVDNAREAPNLTSTVMHSAFNLGIAIGPLFGGAALLCGALLAGAGVAVTAWSAVLDRPPRFATT